MSIGSVMANLFGGTPAQAPAQNQMPQPGNLPAQQTQAMQAAPTNPNTPASSDPQAGQGNQPAGAAPEGLDKFNDLWKPVESPAGDANNNGFNVDPKQLMQAAQKIDFTKVIQPAQLQAIAQGGDAAVQAFAGALNQVAQTVYAQSAHATSKIVEQAISRSQETMRNEMPQQIKRLNVSETLRADNPALSHPAAAPILGALEQQITQKYPNASSAEISRMATDYLSSFAGALQKPQVPDQQQNSKETDWSQYLN